MAVGRRFCGLIALGAFLTACQKPCDCPDQPPEKIIEVPAAPDTETDAFQRIPLGWDELPNWRVTDIAPAIEAFSRTCDVFSRQDPEKPLSQDAEYGGTVSDWLPACSVLPKYLDVDQPHRFFEDYFTPFEVVTDDETNRLTGYFEPELAVSERQTDRFSAPIPTRPDDLVEVRLGEFDDGLSGKTIWGQVEGGKLMLYPERRNIATEPEKALAWADPADVFFLQIQGSGRLRFPDGRVVRAGFDSHNHRPFESLANHLIRTGEIERSQASMQGIRNWMARVGEDRAQAAMNINPRFVFFRARDVASPELGPEGAAGIPLTPMGSVAVDLGIHPPGMPFFLETTIPDAGEDWRGTDQSLLLIAQDTGGAIKGIRRGDIFFGSGDEAGKAAGRMNYPGRFFVFLPQDLEVEPAE